MKKILQRRHVVIGVFSLFGLIVSCTTIPYIEVLYRLPPETAELKDKKIFLTFKDLRETTDFLGPGAKADYKNLSENFSFSVARGTDKGFKIGVFDLSSLFMETFKRSFESSGITVLTEKDGEDAKVVIVLKDFMLDLVNRTWQFEMAYEARLVKEGKVLTKQAITGKGERLKIFGRKEANTVVGETFTDMVNRLDVERLLQQGGVY